MQRRHFLLALPAAALAFGGCDSLQQSLQFKSIDITGNTAYGKDFRLTDHNGVPRSLADFKGRAVTLFFGFMNCPDFCPTHLARQNEVLKLLGEDAGRVQTLFVTVDPERDKPESLKAYVTAFNPGFLGLYGSKAEIDTVVEAFRAPYEHVQLKDSQLGYTVNHSTLSIAFDPQGRLRLAMRHELSAADVAHDLKHLLAGR